MLLIRFLLPFALLLGSLSAADRPNIVLVMTDDQGYGDIGAHGNRMIRTPNLDRLHSESVRFTNFHVDPTCAPTRSALMTGKYSSRTGVWHTIMGRSIMAHGEVTLAGILKKAGYRTGFFGKWHLGDNSPYFPEDRGFDEVVRHGGGGVQQTPDYWGNDYFDDTYWHNGVPRKYDGYCTDVWFREAMRFIGEKGDQPFFLYLATNAPHSPYFVDDKYSLPYARRGVPEPMAKFYGMIENFDENLGKLRKLLKEQNLDRNTLFVFLTDNGSAEGILLGPGGLPRQGDGWQGFNAGMRGKKGSEYEGGHRVPLFVHWPEGGLGQPRDISTLTAHIDIVPTLAESTGAKASADIDGRSLLPLLKGNRNWPERTLLVHSQRVEFPIKGKDYSVMTERWRLVNGKELYDMRTDPGQMRDIADQNPQAVARLAEDYDQWWRHISDRFDEYVYIPIGHREGDVRLTAHDWHTGETSTVPWNQPTVKRAPAVNGDWRIEVARDGLYEFQLYERDAPAKYPIHAAEAGLEIAGQTKSGKIPEGADSVSFRLPLTKGETKLKTWFRTAEGAERGAFYLYARRVSR